MDSANPEKPHFSPANSPVPVTELSAREARAYFLKQTSYTTIELPSYFDFESVLEKVDDLLINEPLDDDALKKARYVPVADGDSAEGEAGYHPGEEDRATGVNHVLHDNKDGRLSWRPLTLIHPVLYVAMVHRITEDGNWDTIAKRFREFRDIANVECASVPQVYVSLDGSRSGDTSDNNETVDGSGDVSPFGSAMGSAWFEKVEQASLEQALEFQVVVEADISDCYSSIYTHTIPWALHGKQVAKKERRSPRLIGNQIDWHIQHMTDGQTCGIPQGSELMNFVAEMVLGYGDELLVKELASSGIEHYKVIRFRDDYRIFVDDRVVAEKALGCLYRALRQIQLELRLDKTSISEDVVMSAVREDKRAWLDGDFDRRLESSAESLMNVFVRLQEFSRRFPNSGMLKRGMSILRKRFKEMPTPRFPMPLVSVLTDIAVRNPRVYPAAAALLSGLIAQIDSERDRKEAVKTIVDYTTKAPNTGRLELWLQRIGYFQKIGGQFEETLCQIVAGNDEKPLWDNSWLRYDHARYAEIVAACEIVNWDELQGAPDMLTDEEWDWLLWRVSDYG